MICEIHFTSKSYVSIPWYSTYYTLHPDGSAHGGTAIIIRSNIKHYETRSYSKAYLQATNVVVEEWNGPIIVSAVYSQPKHTIKNSQYEDFFSTLGHRFIADGDFNAKHALWESKTPNPKSRELHKAVQNLHLHTLSTREPTYWPSDSRKTPELLDFCITKGMSGLRLRANSCLELLRSFPYHCHDGQQGCRETLLADFTMLWQIGIISANR